MFKERLIDTVCSERRQFLGTKITMAFLSRFNRVGYGVLGLDIKCLLSNINLSLLSCAAILRACGFVSNPIDDVFDVE